MPFPRGALTLGAAAVQTWGWRGLSRRAAYEASKRSGLLRRAEASWPVVDPGGRRLRSAGVSPVRSGDAAGDGEIGPISLYGALEVDVGVVPDWHRHPVTGHQLPSGVHWSELSDATPSEGDIKDVWELSRLGWLHAPLRRWAALGDDEDAEAVWRTIEDWVDRNPPYLGPNWMCGQETSIRAVQGMFLADALDRSAATTDVRRELIVALVHTSVGRVAPTLGYALSQRNNHAISEAAFLWTAAVLLPSLPRAEALERRAADALAEATADQFAFDGSYAQHSPTYQRLALHMLLWCSSVARSTGVEAPAGVHRAVESSVGFLSALVAPGSQGRVPNLGGNDGALLFDLTGSDIGDMRPVIAHAAAACGRDSGLGPGPWDDEARWFGLTPEATTRPALRAPVTRSTHPLTKGTTHTVVRAGPLDHRPAHADQLHVDIWLDGEPVAVDAGSFRYTAPAPWGNALADERVHNLPARAGTPQAVRSGRFFWRSWSEAVVERRFSIGGAEGLSARLHLDDGTVVRRHVVVGAGIVVVLDHPSAEIAVRWNLMGRPRVAKGQGHLEVTSGSWAARMTPAQGADLPEADPDDPWSGWHSTTYGVREPLTAVVLTVPSGQLAVSCFGGDGDVDRLAAITRRAETLDLGRLSADQLSEMV